MKRCLSIVIALVVMISTVFGNSKITLAKSTELTKREKAIIEAYWTYVKDNNPDLINKYLFKGFRKYISTIDFKSDGGTTYFIDNYTKKYDSGKKMYYLDFNYVKVDVDEYVSIEHNEEFIYLKKSAGVESVYDVLINSRKRIYPCEGGLSAKLLTKIYNNLVKTYGEEKATRLMYQYDDNSLASILRL